MAPLLQKDQGWALGMASDLHIQSRQVAPQATQQPDMLKFVLIAIVLPVGLLLAVIAIILACYHARKRYHQYRESFTIASSDDITLEEEEEQVQFAIAHNQEVIAEAIICDRVQSLRRARQLRSLTWPFDAQEEREDDYMAEPVVTKDAVTVQVSTPTPSSAFKCERHVLQSILLSPKGNSESRNQHETAKDSESRVVMTGKVHSGRVTFGVNTHEPRESRAGIVISPPHSRQGKPKSFYSSKPVQAKRPISVHVESTSAKVHDHIGLMLASLPRLNTKLNTEVFQHSSPSSSSKLVLELNHPRSSPIAKAPELDYRRTEEVPVVDFKKPKIPYLSITSTSSSRTIKELPSTPTQPDAAVNRSLPHPVRSTATLNVKMVREAPSDASLSIVPISPTISMVSPQGSPELPSPESEVGDDFLGLSSLTSKYGYNSAAHRHYISIS